MLYHHTDSGRLPFILRSEKLLPGRDSSGMYPRQDLLWATTDSRGDASANIGAPQGRRAYADGKLLHVRLSLLEYDFFDWKDVRQRAPEWKEGHIERLERSGREMGSDPSTWRCRVDPLPFSSVLKMEWRSYRSPAWKEMRLDQNVLVFNDGWLALPFGEWLHASRQVVVDGSGRKGYEISKRAFSDVLWSQGGVQ